MKRGDVDSRLVAPQMGWKLEHEDDGRSHGDVTAVTHPTHLRDTPLHHAELAWHPRRNTPHSVPPLLPPPSAANVGRRGMVVQLLHHASNKHLSTFQILLWQRQSICFEMNI